ncbi:MAG TPA: response regulator transcription factor [Terriglobales bacterium]|nr:response regulator transcription factor [Terriglobales bacterium]
MDVICVFILAENRLLREALGRLLSKKNGLRVVGESAFSPQIIEQITKATPDVLLSEGASLATPTGRFIPDVISALPCLNVVMIGMDPSPATFLQAIRDGAMGYILKEASALELAGAVRAVANGEAVCPPILCRHLFQYVAGERMPAGFRLRASLGLTRREQQLVHLMGGGLTNKEIASQLNLSEQTVKNHIHRILRKLGATDRVAAVEMYRLSSVVA